jgi:hypothetical protein
MKKESELTEFQKCLINIKWIFTEMYYDYQDTKNIQTSNSNYLIAKVSKYGFIQVCSFLEECEILNRLSQNDEVLRDTLYVCAPVIRNLNKYKGLRKMRNLMLAHVNRDKLKNFKPWWNELKGLRKPVHKEDINELYESLAFIVDMLNIRHKKEWEEAIPYLEKSLRQFISEDAELQLDFKKSEKTMKEINAEVLKRMEEKNISPLKTRK